MKEKTKRCQNITEGIRLISFMFNTFFFFANTVLWSINISYVPSKTVIKIFLQGIRT